MIPAGVKWCSFTAGEGALRCALRRQTCLLVARGVTYDCLGIQRVLMTQRSLFASFAATWLALLGKIYKISQGGGWFIPRVSNGFLPRMSRLAAYA